MKKLLALLLTLTLVCGLFTTMATAAAEAKPVKLRMIMYGDMTTRREEFFKKDFHDRVLEDLNIDLSVEYLAWGQDSTVATMLASGEAFAVWNIVHAFDWPSKGYLTPIDEGMIRELCPNLVRVRTENNGFECVKHDGQIYAIPFGSKPYAGRMQTFAARNDILKSVGYEAGKITTYEQLMDALEAVHAQYPELRILRSSGANINALNSETATQLINIISGTQFIYVDELEENDKIYSLYESEAFKKLCRLQEDWVAKGYVKMDELSNPTQGAAEWEAGNCLLMYGTPGALIDTSLRAVNPNAEIGLIKIGDMPYLKSIDYDWSFSISASDAGNVEHC